MTVKILPLQDRVVVERCEESEKSPGGILIPDSAKDSSMCGKVLYVGPGAHNQDGKVIPLTLKPGDRVIFPKWAGTKAKETLMKVFPNAGLNPKEDWLIMKESEVLAVIDN